MFEEKYVYKNTNEECLEQPHLASALRSLGLIYIKYFV